MPTITIRYIFRVLVFFLAPSLIFSALLHLHFSDLCLLLASLVRLAVQVGVFFYLTKSIIEKTLPQLKCWKCMLISIGGALIAHAMLSELIEWFLEKYMHSVVCGVLNKNFEYSCKIITIDFLLIIVFLMVLALSVWCRNLFLRRTLG